MKKQPEDIDIDKLQSLNQKSEYFNNTQQNLDLMWQKINLDRFFPDFCWRQQKKYIKRELFRRHKKEVHVQKYQFVNQEEVNAKKKQVKSKRIVDLMDQQFEGNQTLLNINQNIQLLQINSSKNQQLLQNKQHFNIPSTIKFQTISQKLLEEFESFPQLSRLVVQLLNSKEDKIKLVNLIEQINCKKKYYLVKKVFQLNGNHSLWEEHKVQFATNCAMKIVNVKNSKEFIKKLIRQNQRIG